MVRRALNVYGFHPALQCHPLALVPHLIRFGRVALLGNQVDVVVLQHGDTPAELGVVAEQGHRVEGLVMPIQVKARHAQLGLVPDRRHRIANMRVTGQDRLAALGAFARYHPGVAALEGANAGRLQRVAAQFGELCQPLPVARAQCQSGARGASRRLRQGLCGQAFQSAFRMAFHIEDIQVAGAQRVADKAHQGFGLEGGSKAISQVARDGGRVLRREGALGNTQHIKLHGRRVRGLKLVDAVQIGL